MWVLLALIAAAATAARETLIKSVMRDGDEAAVAFVVSATAAFVLLPVSAGAWRGSGGGLPPTGAGFGWALVVSGALNAAVMLMLARAVHRSDLSLVSPLQSTTPVFIVLTGWLLLREVPAPAGLAGIAVVVLGAWVLSVQDPTAAGSGELAAAPPRLLADAPRLSDALPVLADTPRGLEDAPPAGTTYSPMSAPVSLLEPFRGLARDSGARLFLGIAVLYAISGTVDKIGVRASSPLMWAAALNMFVAVALLPVLLLGGGLTRVRRLLRTAPRRTMLAGLALAAGAAAQMAALPLTLVAYVIAVKRTSVLFSVLAGALIFRERSVRRRLGGAAIMLAGFLLITLAG